MLPARLPSKPKRDSRWRSPAHTSWIRGFHCCVCGSATNIEAAHIRLGSGAGMARKPDDWRTVPLCAGPYANIHGQLGCHDRQHSVGEATFWAGASGNDAIDVEALLEEFARKSPKAAEIRRVKMERADAV